MQALVRAPNGAEELERRLNAKFDQVLNPANPRQDASGVVVTPGSSPTTFSTFPTPSEQVGARW